MDRKLTDHEKDEYRKKFGPKKSPGPARISYNIAATWSMLALFLFMPQLVDYGIEALGLNTSRNENSASASRLENHGEPILRVYAARTWGPKGVFAVHSWIAMKRPNEDFEVIQVIGWKQDRSGNVLFRETNVPIDSWWGNEATLLLELSGDKVESIIDKVDAAILEYPWKSEYTLYPGPNSNTFVAWIGLKVPEIGLDLPSTAIGKDWRPFEQSLGSSASGTGYQASLFGLLGTSMGIEEGLEVNILGLNFELDLFDLALEIPLFGRYEIWYLLSYVAIWVFIKRWINRTKSKHFYLE